MPHEYLEDIEEIIDEGDDVYSMNELENMQDEDQISESEAGFMMGYNSAYS